MSAPAPDNAPQLEDDVAELVVGLAYQDIVGHGATAAARQQLRDALTTLIDQRIDHRLANR